MAQYATPADQCARCGALHWLTKRINGVDLFECLRCGTLAVAAMPPPVPEPSDRASRLARERPPLPGMGTNRPIERDEPNHEGDH